MGFGHPSQANKFCNNNTKECHPIFVCVEIVSVDDDVESKRQQYHVHILDTDTFGSATN